MKPTKVQREILMLMARGRAILDDCYDSPYAICIGAEHRHIQQRTFEALKANGWVAPYIEPPCSVGYWYLTEAGRALVELVAA